MRKIAVSAIAAACALSATMSTAAPAGEMLATEEVRYMDLDLSSRIDRSTLLKRIRLAAMRVCSPDRFLILRCYEAAMADAIKQLDRKTAEHARRSTAVSASRATFRPPSSATVE